MLGKVLSIAGSDSGGGAGIQADLKTIQALGGFGMTALTAMTAQNTEGVTAVEGVSPDFVVEQIRVVMDDLGVDAIKVGMLHSAAVINAVADYLESLDNLPPIVVDPVMIAKGGANLLSEDAEDAIMGRLLPKLTTLLTPNIPEAECLVGWKIETFEDREKAGRELLAKGPGAVLMKGGHAEGPVVTDLLVLPEGSLRFEHPRVSSRHTHGTGCTLSSAIATGLAQGLPLDQAVERGLRYVEIAILEAPGYGRGHGPLHHGHTVRDF
ncbi:bifunctional hydroxymethylpyrimidine kinase/phosphomethylpyrimidine kinase [Sneathiella chinensis]|uniref:hydroxymethylpyrimidine kinase n=1 Tax=Sneathiella chinensis TaxID=349750 RepID=A0ABQ5U4X6_9PROT|nr:bifunctional hydroxymethylpyrimidine kinase/phosphomethylpyrimidine kinase [Sneathiella chinensis]GLQ06339.1 hydroxymethylpyrimidine/phosphomethylpyrimidine kinase [Sneathiella chinensis]